MPIFLTFALVVGFESQYWTIFLPISTGFHILILILLLLFQNDFYIESTGQKLDRINLANIITLSRSKLHAYSHCASNSRKRIQYTITGLDFNCSYFLTDFFDGLISRKTNQVTKIGRIMDSVSVMRCLLSSALFFSIIYLFRDGSSGSLWRASEFRGCLWRCVIIEKRIEPKSTFMGKVTIASIMVLYTLEIPKSDFASSFPFGIPDSGVDSCYHNRNWHFR